MDIKRNLVMTVEIFYQNVRGLRTKTEECFLNIQNITSDVFCLTETWLNDKFLVSEVIPHNLKVHRRDRNYHVTRTERGGGVLVAYRNNLNAVRVYDFESNISFVEDIWLKFDRPEGNLFLCTVYITSSNQSELLFDNFYAKVMENIMKIDVDDIVLIIGDFNTREIEWLRSADGSIVPRNILSEKAIALDSVLNCGSLTQHNLIKNKDDKILDLVLASKNIGNINVAKSSQYLVSIDGYHPPLQIEADLKLNFLRDNITKKFNFRKANYVLINNEIERACWEELHALPVDDAVDRFYCIVKSIIENMVPKRKRKFRFPFWYSRELIEQIRMKERARKKWKKSNMSNIAAQNVYLELRAKSKRLIKTAHDDYVTVLENNLHKNVKLFWAYTKSRKQSNTYPSQLKYDNESASNSLDICNLFSKFFRINSASNPLMQSVIGTDFLGNISHCNSNTNQLNKITHCSQDVSQIVVSPPLNKSCIVSARNSNFKQSYKVLNVISSNITNIVSPNTVKPNRITVADVTRMLNKLDENKNGGPDGLPNVFLKRVSRSIAEPLCIIFNKSLDSGIFPSQWKRANITPIFKKGDDQDVTNYRPVSLLSTLALVFEKLVHEQVYELVKDKISPRQHGFMRGKSTSSNLNEYIHFIADALDSRFEVHSIYTDFIKAFDSVIHVILLEKLHDIGIKGILWAWFKSYLGGRIATVVFNGSESEPFEVEKGVPQGSVLGPLLFVIFINDLCMLLICLHILFADDLKLYAKVNDVTDCKKLQYDLDVLDRWCIVNQLNLNVRKCFSMHFTNRDIPLKTKYKLSNVELPSVDTICDLGVILDSKLTFHSHYNNITSKAYRMLGFIMRTTKNFPGSKCVSLLYNTMVRSNLEYCSTVWNPYQKGDIEKIERVQRRFTRQLNFRLGLENKSYNERLKQFMMHSLLDRRKYFDLKLLHSTIVSQDSPLMASIKFRNELYPNRTHNLFNPPKWKTDFRKSRNPIVRAQLTYNTLYVIINDIDILTISGTQLKNNILSRFPFQFNI